LIDEEDMVQATQSDISTLCGQNLLLWMQYLELVTFNKIITHHLAKEHHLQRVFLALTVFGRPLSNGSPYAIVLLCVCLSVTLVYCGQMVGWSSNG